MSYKILFCLFAISSLGCLAQTNPEDIIVIYDVKNQDEKVILKSELSSNLDSLSMHLVDEKRSMLLSKKDSLTLRKFLVGHWSFKNSKRSNDKPSNLSSVDKYIFDQNGEFTQIKENDTASGTWFIEKSSRANLTLKFNNPQIAIKDKEILKYLPKDEIKKITFDSKLICIREINDEALVISSFILQNQTNFDNMFFRLVLTTYNRKSKEDN